MTRRRMALAALLAPALLAALWTTACERSPAGSAEPVNPLYVDPAERDFAANPELLERILSGPHGYFRFVNVPFSAEVCRRFAAAAEAPAVNLHGDAHIEQYAVTDLGRGLTDFDDSSLGPAVLDLLRLGVSLELMLADRGWSAASEELFDTFLGAYRRALEDPAYEVPEPVYARRVREGFSHDREAYFEWIESLMEPLPAGADAELEAALEPYVRNMLDERPDLEPAYFEVVSTGRLRMGIGSALDRKYLVRVAGPGPDPRDDVVLELKEVRDLHGIDCITLAQGTFRILVAQSRIAYSPYRLLGYVELQGHDFWVHAWVDNYREVGIGESFESLAELREVVTDIGVQLGRGHPSDLAGDLELQLRRALVDMLDDQSERLRSERLELARQTVEAWERFVAAAPDAARTADEPPLSAR